jgi:hypothetical protein
MFSKPNNLCLLGYGLWSSFFFGGFIKAAVHEENSRSMGAATSGGIYMGNDTTANKN